MSDSSDRLLDEDELDDLRDAVEFQWRRKYQATFDLCRSPPECVAADVHTYSLGAGWSAMVNQHSVFEMCNDNPGMRDTVVEALQDFGADRFAMLADAAYEVVEKGDPGLYYDSEEIVCLDGYIPLCGDFRVFDIRYLVDKELLKESAPDLHEELSDFVQSNRVGLEQLASPPLDDESISPDFPEWPAR